MECSIYNCRRLCVFTITYLVDKKVTSVYIAPVASLLAALSYEKGEGALAQRCLDRALADDPSYSLASLLRRVFSAGWPPESFSAMRKDLHPKVCAGIFESN